MSLLQVLVRLSKDTRGFVISTELILVSSVAVLGLASGLAALQSGVAHELTSTANDFQTMRKSFSQPINTQEISSSLSAVESEPVADNCTVISYP